MKHPLVATVYYACNSVPSVESRMLLTIIEAKMVQIGRRSKCATFLNNYLCYRDSYQIMIYIDCIRTKGSLDKESL